MPFVPVENVALLELRQSLDGENIENTSYWRQPSAWTSGQLLALANFGADWFVDHMLPLLSSLLTFREGFVTDLTTATSGIANYSYPTSAVGAVGLESAPNNVAACISMRTAKRGRANRGRNYIGGLPDPVLNQNTLTPGFMAAVVSAYNQLLADGATSGFEMVVVSRFSGHTIVDGKKKPTPRAIGLAEPVVSFSFTDNTVDSLRTRLPHH